MNNKIYFGFAISDSMFSNNSILTIHRTPLFGSIDVLCVFQNELREIVSCLNPSHKATIDVLFKRYPHCALYIDIPTTPPKVTLNPGDALIVMGVRGLPRLTDRHEYTKEEISNAEFSFSMYEVLF